MPALRGGIMTVTERKICELKPYPNNPRKNREAVAVVAKSIRRFGFKVPVVVDSSGVIVCGHTRVEAARSLGMDKVPCVEAEGLTEDQIKAFRIADNRTGELAVWDFAALDAELEKLSGMGLEGFGFKKSAEPTPIDDVFKEPEPEVCPYCGGEL